MCGTVCILVQLVITWMIACLRPKHAQLSTFVKTTGRYIKWHCPRGKRKVKGRPQPFDWTVPRKVAEDVDLWYGMDQLHEELQAKGAARAGGSSR